MAKKWYDIPEMGNDQELVFTRERMISPGDVVFDCGSHQGMTTVLFSKWVGESGKVVAFEALPENYEVLKRNLELNGATNVEAVHAAVGSEKGTATLDVRPNANVSTGDFGMTVPMICLDEYADRRPNLLKIDVEGYEAELLKGARKIMATRPKVILELHTKSLPEFGTSVAEILELLGLDRYQVWIQAESEQEPAPYGGEAIETRVHLYLLPQE
jgi:FkbM family methyltransferase